MMELKNLLKYIFPVTIRRFNEELSVLCNNQKQLSEKMDTLLMISDKINGGVNASVRFASEAVWAAIFNNTITNSVWLKDKEFSPGRWAVGYQSLYVMYRILNEVRPARILELGLGQSTRLTAQYASYYQAEHYVVEHDQSWIEFFSNSFKALSNTNIIRLDREFIKFKDAEKVRVFKSFAETFSNKTFNFIIIDAPLGGDMKQYARVDVCKLMPGLLEKSFVIIIDDSNRIGEINTIVAMEEVLQEYGIAYKKGKYIGQNDCTVICSDDLGFVTSM